MMIATHESCPSGSLEDLISTSGSAPLFPFGGGLPASECIPVELIRRAADRVLSRCGSAALGYGSSCGDAGLREWIAGCWLPRYRISAHPDEILITHGSQQALDLLGKVLLERACPVAVERPTYLAALQAFRLHHPMVREVSMLADGPDPDALARALRGDSSLHDSHARLFYSIPTFQNPSGVLSSLARRKEIVAELLRHPSLLVEDDPYGELYYDEVPPPPLHALGVSDGALLGTFSKVVAPGFRIGFVRTSRSLVTRLNQVRQASDLCSSPFSQLVLLETLRSLDLERHLESLRLFYRLRRDAMQNALVSHCNAFARWHIPRGGMFFWLQLQPGFPVNELLQACRQQGVVLANGAAFFASNPQYPALRLNFTACTAEQIDAGVRILAGEFQRLQGSVSV